MESLRGILSINSLTTIQSYYREKIWSHKSIEYYHPSVKMICRVEKLPLNLVKEIISDGTNRAHIKKKKNVGSMLNGNQN